MIPSLSMHKPIISEFLKKFLEEQKHYYKKHFWSKDYLNRLEKYMLGGKMIRGSLVIALYEIFAEKNTPPSNHHLPTSVIKTATVMELLQAALLLHDDILDQDELRRGSPAMHTQYKNLAQKDNYSDPKHFGTGMAICGGDVAFGLCFSLLANLDTQVEIKTQLQALFSQELGCVAFAEAHDFEMAFTNRKISKDEILDMYKNKTGRYSLSLPMMAGAILAQQPQRTLDKLEKIGEILGTIFQIKDDEIGIFGEEKETGKPSGNDIREGKKTLFWYYLQEYRVSSIVAQPKISESKLAEVKKALEFFGKNNLSEKEIEFVRRAIKNCGILKKVSEDIQKLSNLATLELNYLDVSPSGEEFFVEFLEFSRSRKK